jgi:hypothetical protein
MTTKLRFLPFSRLSQLLVLSTMSPLLMSAAALADPVGASYTVPVASELASVATFALPQFSLQPTESGQSIVSFTLPPELTGTEKQEIDLSGELPASEGASTTLDGAVASANCVRQAMADVCTLNYKPVYRNNPVSDANTYLMKNFTGSPDLQSRLLVADHFSNDPAGVVSFPAP